MTEIKKAVVSGILISIGGCVLIASTKSGMMWAGAVLFSLGLFAICEYGFNLYTGTFEVLQKGTSQVFRRL